MYAMYLTKNRDLWRGQVPFMEESSGPSHQLPYMSQSVYYDLVIISIHVLLQGSDRPEIGLERLLETDRPLVGVRSKN
jgi:hypothetical protein